MQNVEETFKPFFYPESVAIIGASTKPMKFGNWLLNSLIQFGYGNKGKIYPINPHGIDICGLKSYKELRNLPESVDLTYITVPSDKVLDNFRDCIEQKVKAVIILTSGFKETGEQKGIELEKELTKLAKESNTRIIGPNCFGVYCPEGGLTLLPGERFSRVSGDIAFISQSGGVAVELIRLANSYGLTFSKVISFGNACDITAADLVEYLAADPQTKIIGGYLEGMKNGNEFLDKIKKLDKPFIISKGGLTEAGARASFSHTGFLASKPELWEGLSKQFPNIIKVDSNEELFETLLALYKLPPPNGRNLGIIGGGGAIGVALADLANKMGLNIPKLSSPLKSEIQKFLPLDGSVASNPVDLGNPIYKFSTAFKNILFTMAEDQSINIIINDQITTQIEREDLRAVMRTIKSFKQKFNYPLIVILRQISKKYDELDLEEKTRMARDSYLSYGIPVYESFFQAIRAVKNYIQYYEKNKKNLNKL